jgi:hypothetical protein
MTESVDPLRTQLARLLAWEEAHVGFDKAVEGIPTAQRGARAPGFDHSPWQLIEHMRIAQKDILDFCLNPGYIHTLEWPGDYWPKTPGPADDAAWDKSLADFKADREAIANLALDARVDLFALVPAGEGPQTYLRAILLVADHAAYHVGQLIAVRRALGVWGP